MALPLFRLKLALLIPLLLTLTQPADAQRGLLCTGDPMAGTVPVENVIGKARFIAWPPSRWGGVPG